MSESPRYLQRSRNEAHRLSGEQKPSIGHYINKFLELSLVQSIQGKIESQRNTGGDELKGSVESDPRPDVHTLIALEEQASLERRKQARKKLPPIRTKVFKRKHGTAKAISKYLKLPHIDTITQTQEKDLHLRYEIALAILLAGAVISTQVLHPVKPVDVEKALPAGPSPKEPGEIVQYALGGVFYVPQYKNEIDSSINRGSTKTAEIPPMKFDINGR